MYTQFQKLQLQNDLEHAFGIKIVAPLSGQVQSLASAADPIARSGWYGEGVVITPQQPNLVAPFDGRIQRHDQNGELISFIHANGLRLDVRFPVNQLMHGQGYLWQLPWQSQVRRGQLVMQFDPLILAHSFNPLCCVITVQDHPRFSRILSTANYVQAGIDILLVIELKESLAV